jgi:hypothetical protein
MSQVTRGLHKNHLLWLRLLCINSIGASVDGGYSDRLVARVSQHFKFRLAVLLRPKETKKFILLPRRLVVERTFG